MIFEIDVLGGQGRAPQERRGGQVRHDRPPAHQVGSLPSVMSEIVDLMHARAAMLTLHSSNCTVPTMLYADAQVPEQTWHAVLHMLTHRVRQDFRDGECFWREASGTHQPVLLMPVEQSPGHGRLVISVLFDQAGVDRRREVEFLFQQRRPFAIGFFQLWQQNRVLHQRTQSLEAVLDRTDIGMLMLNRGGQIIFANQTAQEILAEGDGIGSNNGALRATHLADGVNLQAAISHAISDGRAGGSRAGDRVPLLAFHRRKAPPLVGTLLPAQAPPVERGDVAAIMYLIDPQIDTGKMLSPLCKLYALSPVETALVCHLASGETLASAAQKMHVKEQTARGYLKTVFIKTQTKRQTELIVLMLSSLIRMKRDVLQEALTLGGSERALGIRN